MITFKNAMKTGSAIAVSSMCLVTVCAFSDPARAELTDPSAAPNLSGPSAASCPAELSESIAKWSAIPFVAPVKPGQMITYSPGRTMTASSYNLVLYKMRNAAEDCQHGNAQAALQNVEEANQALAGARRIR